MIYSKVLIGALCCVSFWCLNNQYIFYIIEQHLDQLFLLIRCNFSNYNFFNQFCIWENKVSMFYECIYVYIHMYVCHWVCTAWCYVPGIWNFLLRHISNKKSSNMLLKYIYFIHICNILIKYIFSYLWNVQTDRCAFKGVRHKTVVEIIRPWHRHD